MKQYEPTLPNHKIRNSNLSSEQLITIKQLGNHIALSKSAIYRRMDTKDKLYDPTFPRQIKLTVTTGRWLASEVDRWVEQQIEKQRGQKA